MAKLLFLCSLFFAVTTVHAQWQTETIKLQPGWNAVYLHVDPSYVTLDGSVGSDTQNPITEIWLWQPVISEGRFILDPQQPVSGNDWLSWNRTNALAGTLGRLIGNAAYLVRNSSLTEYTWSIKGKPVPPRYNWTSKGVNLLGFATPANAPPSFGDFLRPALGLATLGEFYRYDDIRIDGAYDLTPSSFKSLLDAVPVRRGQAFWIRSTNQFNRYFGAFEVSLQNSSGIHFQDFVSQYSLRVRNLTTNTITLTNALLLSEAAPSGETAIAALPPLLLRGALNATNLTYAFTTFTSGPQIVPLQPSGKVGSEVELILGVNRAAMTGKPGTLYAGILRLTDSLGYSQVDLPVSATPAASSGLWVGNALVGQVRNNLKNYERDTNNQPVLAQGKQSIAASDTAGLLLEMRLDEGSGTIVRNSAPDGSPIQGTLINSPVWLNPRNGPPTDSARPALQFDATQQQYVDLGGGVVFGANFTEEFTEEAWIYPTGTGPLAYGILGAMDTAETAPSLYVGQGHNLSLKTINDLNELTQQGIRLVIVARVGTEQKLHFRFFDADGVATDVAEADLSQESQDQLPAFKQELNGFYDNDASLTIDKKTTTVDRVRFLTGLPSTSRAVEFRFADVNNVLRSRSTVNLLTHSNWNHVATTFDGTTLKIYVNGIAQLTDSTTFAGKLPKPLPVKWIGKVDNYFQGRIAQVRLWNVARTKEQIQSAMFRSQLTPSLGQYVVTNTVSTLGEVARPFPLRLIVHNNGTESRLLQRVYHGLNVGTNEVLATRQSLLHPGLLSSARRISAAHLPWNTANSGWGLGGQFALGQILTNRDTIISGFSDYASNPFLHSFHPDHDNLNATFSGTEPRGVESYDIERRIKLTFTPPGNDFASLISGGTEMNGRYEEEITLKGLGNESRRIDTAGTFLLKRISDIATLTTQ